LRRISIEVHEVVPAPILKKEEKGNFTDYVGNVKEIIQQKLRGEMIPLLPKHNEAKDEVEQHYERALVRILVPKVVVTKAAADITKGTMGVAVSTIGTAVDITKDITKGSLLVTKKGATAIQSALRKSHVAGVKIDEDLQADDEEIKMMDDSYVGSIPSRHEYGDDEDDTVDSTDMSIHRSPSDSDRFGRKWTSKYVFGIRDIHIVKREKEVCTVQIHLQDNMQERKIIFGSELVAISFMDFLQDQQQKEILRVESRLKASMGDLKIPNLTDTIDLLIEIVGLERLSRMNRRVDPFVTVILDGKEIHQTEFMSNW
jgi:hypothetical protein